MERYALNAWKGKVKKKVKSNKQQLESFRSSNKETDGNIRTCTTVEPLCTLDVPYVTEVTKG